MNIKDTDRWRFLTHIGKCDVNVYEDGSVGFITLGKPEYPNFGGKDWQGAVDNGIRKFVKGGFFTVEK